MESMDDNPVWMRAKELGAQGLDFWTEALRRAWFEQNIKNWPSDWGEDLLVVFYGDFLAPSEDIVLPSLGIRIDHENKKNSKFNSAQCVLDVWIKVKEKSKQEVFDALTRLNIFLGVWVIYNGGVGACSWWSFIINGNISNGPATRELNIRDLDPVFGAILKLPDPVRRKVNAALYWVRAPRNLSMDRYLYEKDLLRVYSGYWNAFECLVYAVNKIRPQQATVSKSEKRKQKQEQINQFIEIQKAQNGKLTIADIEKCYYEIVNPGLSNAIHALKACFSKDADRYINECFKIHEDRTHPNHLYSIRNAIDHGDIDAENPEELLRIESRLLLLQEIVLGIFGRLIQLSTP